MGDLRIEVSGAQGDALVIGLGPAEAVEEYLADAPVDRVLVGLAPVPSQSTAPDAVSRSRATEIARERPSAGPPPS